MRSAPAHPDEPARLAQLRDLELLDTAPEEALDRITRLAQSICDVPIALVSLVDEDRQWFKSKQGLGVVETDRDISFCAHAILESGAFVVDDARADIRFADNPLVAGGPRIGFYAGIPLRMPGGLPAGTLCVLDHERRTLSADVLERLHDLAGLAEHLFALRQLASLDSHTGLRNRRGFLTAARDLLRLAERERRPVALAYLDIDGLKAVNDHFGHDEGDRLISALADALTWTFREADVLGRLGGDEFAVLMYDSNVESASVSFERLADALSEINGLDDEAPNLDVSVGCVAREPSGPGIGELMALADEAMYESKAGRSANSGTDRAQD
jgi:diguanylate cyclase (GGDEF)-like protein